MLPVDFECPDCEVEMEPTDTEFDDESDEETTAVFECPECGYMIEFYEDDGETYANDIY